MIWRMMLCVIAAAAVLGGCGGKDKPLDEQADLEKYFGKKYLPPSDRSVRVMARPSSTEYTAGDAVTLDVLLNNSYKKARTLPFGIETPEGLVATYLSAAIEDPQGQITPVKLASDTVEGDLYAPEIGDYGSVNAAVDMSRVYEFTAPGRYRIVLFYTVEEGKLPNGSEPEWTGTVWSSPITFVVQ